MKPHFTGIRVVELKSCMRIYVVLLCAIIALHLVACEHVSSQQQGRMSDDVRDLIERLVSPNEAPDISGDMADSINVYPDRQYHEKQQSVTHARNALLAAGFRAFPLLVQNCDDDRYSYSILVAEWHNVSVGEACFRIIQDQVEFRDYPYRNDSSPYKIKPSYLIDYCRDQSIQQWWDERKSRTLTDIQLEALNWTIAEEDRIGFASVRDRDRIMATLLARRGMLGKRAGHEQKTRTENGTGPIIGEENGTGPNSAGPEKGVRLNKSESAATGSRPAPRNPRHPPEP